MCVIKLYFPIVLFYDIITGEELDVVRKLYFPIVLFYDIIKVIVTESTIGLYFPIVLFYDIIWAGDGNKAYHVILPYCFIL